MNSPAAWDPADPERFSVSTRPAGPTLALEGLGRPGRDVDDLSGLVELYTNVASAVIISQVAPSDVVAVSDALPRDDARVAAQLAARYALEGIQRRRTPTVVSRRRPARLVTEMLRSIAASGDVQGALAAAMEGLEPSPPGERSVDDRVRQSLRAAAAPKERLGPVVVFHRFRPVDQTALAVCVRWAPWILSEGLTGCGRRLARTYVSVMPSAVVSASEGVLVCPLRDGDNGVVLDTAAGLWDPSSDGRLSDPLAALETARLVCRSTSS